ncbi:unnamed protein product [Nesidiocoris tenuis]|uniref:Uncharacterized protein n=1 Tax=Nesidiocoris tenuis TaxID=355587 RepID=A0A6H5HDP8_9HEMI|nr:unnamed protein product [Nesidiocoris tenuis]
MSSNLLRYRREQSNGLIALPRRFSAMRFRCFALRQWSGGGAILDRRAAKCR